MSLTAKNIGLNAGYYAATLALGPWVFLSVEGWLGIPRFPSSGLRVASAVAGLGGATLQLWCIVLFQREGRGTPSPALPPRRLVVAGPYRHVRNPMNLGEIALFLALASWFGSAALLAYAASAFAAFHLFAVAWQEPHLRRAFGDEYVRYEAAVPRWLPALGRCDPRGRGT